MTFRRLKACVLSVLLIWQIDASAQTQVRYQLGVSANDSRYEYFLVLLDMALSATRQDYGDYQLIRSERGVSQQRAFELLSAGQGLDVFWGMTSLRRETLGRAVPFPLMRGLLGVRVALTTPQGAEALGKVTSIQDLSQLTAVQGDGWPDTRILRHNGLPVITSSHYESLFQMLRYQRSDYFPRSVAEVWAEQEGPLGEGLEIHKGLLLSYRSPIYFFVHRDNEALARRLQKGLERLWQNGLFNNLFYSRPELRRALDLINHGDYRVLRLAMPWQLPSIRQIPDDYWLPLPGSTTTTEP
ncbi:hypothetical protein H9C73_11985 [Marinobacterium sp. AK62]|uniref:Solute-binding protein family 3/N-terminal domain-containing protein n=1 Tax=Marinobacterium alkalitolerans TaxID=1542925 RepID=A0ABS3ZCP1_9GAMM|nr:hypothetical protein [Marinobacterium alkalitolerans]MBP0049457.1 hypothetical protein [Marinobacterium alkalitolerans]